MLSNWRCPRGWRCKASSCPVGWLSLWSWADGKGDWRLIRGSLASEQGWGEEWPGVWQWAPGGSCPPFLLGLLWLVYVPVPWGKALMLKWEHHDTRKSRKLGWGPGTAVINYWHKWWENPLHQENTWLHSWAKGAPCLPGEEGMLLPRRRGQIKAQGLFTSHWCRWGLDFNGGVFPMLSFLR